MSEDNKKKIRELVRIAEAQGWTVVEKGYRYKMVGPGGQTVFAPADGCEYRAPLDVARKLRAAGVEIPRK